MMAIENIQSLREFVVKEINKILDEKYGADSVFRRLIKSYFDKKGKKLRPLLCVSSYKLVNPEADMKKVIPLAAAIEITHNASLIIDDVFDRDIRRRGDAAFYVKHGTFAALSVSYHLSAFVLSLTTRTKNMRVIHEMAKMGEELSFSVFLSRNLRANKIISKDLSMKILKLKTASLFRAATITGAILAGGTDDEIKRMEKFGEYYGIAYQLRDDALAILNDTPKIGKEGDSDITNRLQTLIFLEAVERASPSDREILKQYYLRNAEYDVEIIRKILIDSGAVEQVLNIARNYIHKAREQIEVFPDSTAKKNIEELMKYIEI